MKRKIICYSVMLSIISNCFAQKVNLTLFTGYHLSNYLYAATSGTRTIQGSFHMGLEGAIKLSKINSVGLSAIFVEDKNLMKRNFNYKDINFFDNPRVEDNYKLQWIKIPLVFIHQFRKCNNLFYSASLIPKFNVIAARNGTAYISGISEEYSDKYKIDTKNSNSVVLAVSIALGFNSLFKIPKFSGRLFFEGDLSKWRYRSNFELEKEVYYPFRAITIGIDLGYVF